MRFCSLGSGSEGNAHIVEKGDTTLLIECGFSPRTLKKRLAQYYISPSALTAVFISHEHNDHVAGLALIKQYEIACYTSAGTARALRYPPNWRCLHPSEEVTVNELTIRPVPVPHDANEPLQFIIDDGVRRLAIFTDLGHVSRTIRELCADADALVIECNYDDQLLAGNNTYPESVKRRIAGNFGHLSNAAAAALVETTKSNKRRQLIGVHLSEQNNREALVREALAGADNDADIHVASQQDGTDWIVL